MIYRRGLLPSSEVVRRNIQYQNSIYQLDSSKRLDKKTSLCLMIQYFCQCQIQMGKCWNKWMALKTGSGSNANGGGAFTEIHSSINNYSASMMNHLTRCYTWDDSQSVSKTWLNCTYIPVYWGKEAMSFNFFHSFWSCTWTQTQKHSTHNEVALVLNELITQNWHFSHLWGTTWWSLADLKTWS